jgi:hypothetical protein
MESQTSIFPEALKRMEFLEALYAKKEDQRFEYCRTRLKDPSISVAMSAAYSMAAIDPQGGIAILSSKEAITLHVAAQIDMDRSVMERAPEKWKLSEARAKLIARWSEPDDDDTLMYVIRDLSFRCQSHLASHNQIPHELAGACLAAIAYKDRGSEAIRIRASKSKSLLLFTMNTGIVDQTFNAYVGILSGKSSPKLRRTCAIYLPALVEKNPSNMELPRFFTLQQIERLVELHKAEKDPEVAKFLLQAIEKAKHANQNEKR